MINYVNFFLVSNYKNSKKTDKEVDSFVAAFTSKNKYAPNTEEIGFFFYKETSKTNLIAIKRNPSDVDLYSNEHDLIYFYSLKPDGSKERKKFKNGDAIETTEKKIHKLKFKISDYHNID